VTVSAHENAGAIRCLDPDRTSSIGPSDPVAERARFRVLAQYSGGNRALASSATSREPHGIEMSLVVGVVPTA